MKINKYVFKIEFKETFQRKHSQSWKQMNATVEKRCAFVIRDMTISESKESLLRLARKPIC